jgi:hypothetical protein
MLGDLAAGGQPDVRLLREEFQRLVEVFRPEGLPGHEGVQRPRHHPAAPGPSEITTSALVTELINSRDVLNEVIDAASGR